MRTVHTWQSESVLFAAGRFLSSNLMSINSRGPKISCSFAFSCIFPYLIVALISWKRVKEGEIPDVVCLPDWFTFRHPEPDQSFRVVARRGA